MSAHPPSQSSAQAARSQLRITRLASQPQVHRAFGWLHLHELQLRAWQLAMLAIPAPTFAEEPRAAWFLERFRELGLVNTALDDVGNVTGELLPKSPDATKPFVLVSAHLDTVFPVGTETVPREEGSRILGPGACDNGAGLTGLLGLIGALRSAGITPGLPVLFAANVGEEGEGDLRGMRHLFLGGAYRDRISAAVALEGSGTATAVDRALGSRRFRVTVSGPGGHSWTDASVPNPILLVSEALLALDRRMQVNGTEGPRSTLSPGCISGGTSINSIPASARVLLDLRSTDVDELRRHELEVHRTFEHVVAAHHTAPMPLKLQIEAIGDRPAAALPADAPILGSLRAVDRHLGLRTELRLGSTDANIPLALGIPALAVSAGGTGGGIHTLEEWYDPAGRETALRRILLLLLDLVG